MATNYGLARIKNIVTIGSIFGLAASFGSVQAQEPYEPVYESVTAIVNVSWSADGNTLTFQEAFPLEGGQPDIGVQTKEFDNWHQLGQDGIALNPTNLWPQQVSVAESLQVDANLATDNEGNISFTFMSPDNSFMVYAAQQPSEWNEPGWPLAIADLQNGNHTLIRDLTVVALTNFDSGYDIDWSGDSSAFTVEMIGISGQNRACYVTNYTQAITGVTSSCFEQGISINDEVRYPYKVYDISQDGSRVIVEDVINGTERRLFIWDVQNPSDSQTITQGSQYIEAAFSNVDDDRIRFVNLEGLVEYSLKDQTSIIVDSTINAAWGDEALFSPSGEKIAVLDNNALGASSLYVIDVNTLQ